MYIYFQRNFRWIKPLKPGTYIMVVHYYQPLYDAFPSKVIVMTYQRAVAGKVFQFFSLSYFILIFFLYVTPVIFTCQIHVRVLPEKRSIIFSKFFYARFI